MNWLQWLLHPFDPLRSPNKRVRESAELARDSTDARDAAYYSLMGKIDLLEEQIRKNNGK